MSPDYWLGFSRGCGVGGALGALAVAVVAALFAGLMAWLNREQVDHIICEPKGTGEDGDHA